jgi:general secretion pathway protein J
LKKGFTLIEIVVALLIFSIIAVMMAAGLNFLIRAESSLKTQAEQLEALQMTRLLMERNLSQVVDRSITIDAKTQYPAFIGDTAIIEFTHGGYINPQGQFTRSTLQRTAYLLENGALIERDWSALDRAPKTLTRDRILIKNVGSMAFR